MAKKFLTKMAWEMLQLLMVRNTLAVSAVHAKAIKTPGQPKRSGRKHAPVTLQLDPDRTICLKISVFKWTNSSLVSR